MQRTWPSTPGRAALALAAVSTVGLAGSIALRSPGSLLPFFDVVVYNLALVAAALVLLLRGLAGSRITRPWIWIALGLLWLSIGTLIWTYFPTTYFGSTKVLVSDVVMLTFYPFAITGLVRITTRRLGDQDSHARIDIALFGIGSFAATTALLSALIGSTSPTADLTEVFVLNGYLLGDLILGAIALTAAQAFRWRPPMAWWLLFAGSLSFAVADAIWLIVSTRGTYTEGGILDLGWPLSALLLALAGYADRAELPPEQPRVPTGFVGPSAAVVAATAVLVLPGPGPLAWLAMLAAVATIAGAMHRLLLAIGDAKHFADELQLARIDHLTGLRSRSGLFAVSPAALRQSALVVINVDRFNEINDSFGSEAGDRLLRLVGQRLRDAVRGADVIARIGGDEFAVLAVASRPESALTIAENLLAAIEEPLNIDGTTLHMTACAGVVSNADVDTTMSVMLGEASAALQRAKSEGPGLARTADGNAGERTELRLRMRSEVRAAFRDGAGDFLVYYQPIVDLRTQRVFAVEALVRWRRAGQVLAPGEFLDAVLQSGQMVALTEHMLNTSIAELKGAGLDVPVSVNVPPDLINDALLERVRSAARRNNVTNDRLIVEITEDALMRDPEHAAMVLSALRDDGFKVLLDDFGTGWSGLSALRDLAVDGLKLDGSFVSRLPADRTSEVIVRSVAGVAAELDIFVIYEGLENPDDLPYFQDGFEGYLQGFAIARPMPLVDLARWIHARGFAV